MNFLDFARLHGLIIRELYASERIRRCPTENKERKDNGAYFFDGRRGWVKLWDGDAVTHWWNDENATPWTDAEKRAWAARRQAEAAKREAGYVAAASSAAHLMRSCKQVQGHPYLKNKQLGETVSLVSDSHQLFVPMRDIDSNILVGGQMIVFDTTESVWKKKFIPGMRAKGAVLRLGSKAARETWLCEGYATGLTIDAALRRLSANASVLVCFSAGNMVHVADQVSGTKFTFADNDRSHVGQRSAEAIGAPWVMSSVEGNDANDDMIQFGILHVCKTIMTARANRRAA